MSEYLELKEQGFRKVLTLNSVKCLECGEVLVSKSQHHFRSEERRVGKECRL